MKNKKLSKEEQKTIELLREAYNSADLSNFDEIETKIRRLMAVIKRFFPEDNEKNNEIKKILNVLKFRKKLKDDDAYTRNIVKYKLCLKSLEKYISDFGFPQMNSNSDNSINIVQPQSISIDFYIDIIKDTFSEDQISQIREVIKEEKRMKTSNPE